MTRTSGRLVSRRTAASTLDSWLLGEPELDSQAISLLTAYRDAAVVARGVSAAAATDSESSDIESTSDNPGLRGQPAVLRLRTLEGIAADRFADLHGRLLAAGYVTAELQGRADGLAYRITREGLRRLSGETVDGEAA